MKKILFIGLLLILIGIGLYYKEDIVKISYNFIRGANKKITLENKNEYYRDYDFEFVQNTDNFIPTNKQELYNVFYTVINSGNDEFTFYCSYDYKECINDVQELAKDQTILSDINNYVHPFNSFKHIYTKYDAMGKVTLTLEKMYTDEEISLISQKVDSLSNSLIIENDSDYNNILRVHDYIINNAKYDLKRSDYNDTTYKSNIAYGPLFEGYAICGGYTDLMELYLEKMNIKSYKVSSFKHVWNAVYYNNSWLNLDLTWDDPVVNDGKYNYLEHNFFLITTSKLHEIEKTEHEFDYNSYPELKEA